MNCKDLGIRIINQQLLSLIEDWDALDSMLDQEIPSEDEVYIWGCMNTLEKAMITLVNQAESERLISWDDWRIIHRILMFIGVPVGDRDFFVETGDEL